MAVIEVDTGIKTLGTVRPPARDLVIGAFKVTGPEGEVAKLKRAITSAELEMTIEGASTLTVQVRDASRNLLRSELVQTRRSKVIIDNVEYTLVKVGRDGETVSLVFEETAVNLLRQYDSPKKANRANTTRAQFIASMVKEVKERTIPFFCPDLNQRQRALKPKLESDETPTARAPRVDAPVIRTRAQWGATTSIPGDRHVAPADRRYFVVHWPVMSDEDEPQLVRAIEQEHHAKWDVAPGYNFLVGNRTGTIFEGCGRDVRGVHCPSRNTDGWGVCVMQPMSMHVSDDAKRATRQLYEWLCQVAGHQLVMGWHGKYYATQCPGQELINWVRGGMRIQGAGAEAPVISNEALQKLTVKGTKANKHQLEMGKLIVLMCRQQGGDRESCAGAIATAIQESSLTDLDITQGDPNVRNTESPSIGLFQQRPPWWGTPEQIEHHPEYQVGKFLEKYLALRKQGQGWLDASYNTQHPDPKYRTDPAKWYSEGVAWTNVFIGWKGSLESVTLGGSSGSYSVTRTLAYEFSRGSADQKETSWQAARRLADEVQRRFFCRGGEIWYVADDWLVSQPRVATLSEATRGVVSFSFESESRREAEEATLNVLASRYALLPGDVIEVQEEGAGSGTWLVATVRRALNSRQAEVSLTREREMLPEPAPETATDTVSVNLDGTSTEKTSGAGALDALMNLPTSPGASGAAQAEAGWMPTSGVVKASTIEEASRMIRQQFPLLKITSTTGGVHSAHSLHYQGFAHDLAIPGAGLAPSARKVYAEAAQWIMQSGLYQSLTEGIHNSGSVLTDMSVADGKKVASTYWLRPGESPPGATWLGHRDHLHIAIKPKLGSPATELTQNFPSGTTG